MTYGLKILYSTEEVKYSEWNTLNKRIKLDNRQRWFFMQNFFIFGEKIDEMIRSSEEKSHVLQIGYFVRINCMKMTTRSVTTSDFRVIFLLTNNSVNKYMLYFAMFPWWTKRASNIARMWPKTVERYAHKSAKAAKNPVKAELKDSYSFR